MTGICLRSVSQATFRECIALDVAEDQREFVAPNVYSLAQAKVNELLTPWAIYDRAILGRDLRPDDTMRGFLMVQEMDGVGFIMRLMIDHRWQRRGYGRAAMEEIIRRWKASPHIEMIATSVRKGNDAAETLYRSLGFVDNPMVEDERERYLLLDWPPGTVSFVEATHGKPS